MRRFRVPGFWFRVPRYKCEVQGNEASIIDPVSGGPENWAKMPRNSERETRNAERS
jgi:hypothetical protein